MNNLAIKEKYIEHRSGGGGVQPNVAGGAV